MRCNPSRLTGRLSTRKAQLALIADESCPLVIVNAVPDGTIVAQQQMASRDLRSFPVSDELKTVRAFFRAANEARISDEKGIREITARALDARGYKALSAKDGTEALAVYVGGDGHDDAAHERATNYSGLEKTQSATQNPRNQRGAV